MYIRQCSHIFQQGDVAIIFVEDYTRTDLLLAVNASYSIENLSSEEAISLFFFINGIYDLCFMKLFAPTIKRRQMTGKSN